MGEDAKSGAAGPRLVPAIHVVNEGNEGAGESHAPSPHSPLAIRIREVLPEENEVNYIVKTWAREFRDYLPAHTPERVYYARQQKVIGDLASKSTIRLAVNPEVISTIYGFAVGKTLSETTLLLHYVYVRREWQRLGIARALIGALGYQPGMEILTTHWSHHISRWIEPLHSQRLRTASGVLRRNIKFPFIVYDPYLLHTDAKK